MSSHTKRGKRQVAHVIHVHCQCLDVNEAGILSGCDHKLDRLGFIIRQELVNVGV